MNHRGAIRRRARIRNLIFICIHNEGKRPQSGKGNRLLGSSGSSETPNEIGPKKEHNKTHHN